MDEGHRRMGELAVIEARRPGQAVEGGIAAGAIVPRRELASDVAGADAQFEHHRRVARLRQREAFLDAAHDRRQVRPRIDQPHGGLHRIGVGALLDDARALAIVLAENDHGAAEDARGGEVRQRVGRDIGADDGFPSHRPAQRIIDGRAEHGRRRRLVGAGLEMDAELGHHVLGVDEHVEEVRHRRALVAADVAHAGLQQRLGDREYALAAEHRALTEPQRFDFRLERPLHGGRLAEEASAWTGRDHLTLPWRGRVGPPQAVRGGVAALQPTQRECVEAPSPPPARGRGLSPSPGGGGSDRRRQSGVGWQRFNKLSAECVEALSPPPARAFRAGDLPPPGGGDATLRG